jgi:hypothetical protein
LPNIIDLAKIEDQLFEMLNTVSRESTIQGMIFFVILKGNTRWIAIQLRDSIGNVVLIGHEELLAVNGQFPSTLSWTTEFNALILGRV